MSSRPITPSSDPLTLISGLWTQGLDYRNWRPQGTRDYLLIYTASGAGRIVTAQSSFKVNPGNWLLYRPETRQEYRTARDPGSWGLLWAHVHPPPTWMPLLDWPEISPGVQLLNLDDQTVRGDAEIALEAMVRYDAMPGRTGKPLAMNALEKALLLADAARPDRQTQTLDARLNAVIDLIHREIDRAWTVDELAALAHLSPSRFAHLFREQIGLTPLQYVEAQRMQRARQLLEQTGLGVGQIALEVGFHCPFYFSRRFRLATGRSPRAYRQHVADGPR